MPTENRIQKQNIGNAGEYYMASILSAHNFTATLTLGRAEYFDILAVTPSGKTYKLSVKTRLETENTAFTLSKHDEDNPSDDFYYVLLRLHNFEKTPEYWIIPSKRVAEVISSAHDKWLKAKGRNGQCHNDTDMRKVPIEARGADREYYPSDWEEEIKNYHNNLSPLV
jgi:hypothetical protein